MEFKIPKTIHYIWFGCASHTALQERCLVSWKKYAPDYKIIRWDETNCDIHENLYVSQAYQAKKWAFVADYFRFKILAEHGGFYLDVDIELHQNIDFLCNHEAFYAFEKQDSVNAGIMGAIPGHPTVKTVLSSYLEDMFIKKNGGMNLLPVPVRVTKILRQNGLVYGGKFQILKDYTAIYPVNVLTLNMGDNCCVAEHHYEFSWRDTKTVVSYKNYLVKEYHRNGPGANLKRMLKRIFLKLRIMGMAKL